MCGVCVCVVWCGVVCVWVVWWVWVCGVVCVCVCGVVCVSGVVCVCVCVCVCTCSPSTFSYSFFSVELIVLCNQLYYLPGHVVQVEDGWIGIHAHCMELVAVLWISHSTSSAVQFSYTKCLHLCIRSSKPHLHGESGKRLEVLFQNSSLHVLHSLLHHTLTAILNAGNKCAD